jgi:hypothetical protein
LTKSISLSAHRAMKSVQRLAGMLIHGIDLPCLTPEHGTLLVGSSIGSISWKSSGGPKKSFDSAVHRSDRWTTSADDKHTEAEGRRQSTKPVPEVVMRTLPTRFHCTARLI